MTAAFPAPDATDGPGSPGSGPGARRARPIYRVFVSSTWLDLQPERRALMEALNRMEEMRFVGMEFFGNRPDDTPVLVSQVSVMLSRKSSRLMPLGFPAKAPEINA